ncbi:hypothetical protein EVAR_80730_1 [Eumeta japonica]|uniref:Uncharacterized protein n=1 Tax=Eumeta variegata TaxID=151549 RepID=A0A4C1U3V4_EUMVA|nr:hypothetical protein EVAR_80730_1 [Eumeta japonica]
MNTTPRRRKALPRGAGRHACPIYKSSNNNKYLRKKKTKKKLKNGAALSSGGFLVVHLDGGLFMSQSVASRMSKPTAPASERPGYCYVTASRALHRTNFVSGACASNASVYGRLNALRHHALHYRDTRATRVTAAHVTRHTELVEDIVRFWDSILLQSLGDDVLPFLERYIYYVDIYWENFDGKCQCIAHIALTLHSLIFTIFIVGLTDLLDAPTQRRGKRTARRSPDVISSLKRAGDCIKTPYLRNIKALCSTRQF